MPLVQKMPTDIQTQIERINTFVHHMIDDKSKAKEWMEFPRREFGNKNAIEMIQSGKLGEVMLYIDRFFFR